jgi:serine phosphatase RsbU (regulator of sigma subunit)
MKIENVNKSLFYPEISIRRLYRVINAIIEEQPRIELSTMLEKVIEPASFRKMIADTNFWISSELESQIFIELQKSFDIPTILLKIAGEVFHAVGYELLPSDFSAETFDRIVLKLPVIFSRYNRTDPICIQAVNDKNFYFEFHSLKNSKEQWQDIYFFLGLLEGAISLFQVKEPNIWIEKIVLKKTKQAFPYTNEHTVFLSPNTVIHLTLERANKTIAKPKTDPDKKNVELNAKSFLVTSIEKGGQKEEYSYIDLDSILDRSKQLYLENRDLEAAVEVLSNLKNELLQKQKSINKDLKLARNIQKGLIPEKIPDWNGLQFGILFLPMQEVSGDYYDYFSVSLDKLGILVSDVSGHGVPAAFITAVAKLLFSNNKTNSPAETLSAINYELIDLIKKQGYITCFYGIMNSNYEFTYCLAGHPNPLLYRYDSGQIEKLNGEGTYLGIFEEARDHLKDYRTHLNPGDKLFVFTDGFTDSQNDEGEILDIGLLKQWIIECKELDVKKTTNYIKEQYANFCRGTDSVDDVTILVFGLSLKMDKLEWYIRESEILSQRKKYHDACKLLLEAYHVFPNDMAILLLLGEYYYKSKNFKDAIIYLESYNKIKKNNYYSYAILGYCYYREREFQNAEVELYRSISLKGDALDVLVTLTKIYIKERTLEKAKYTLERIREIQEDNIHLRYLSRLVERITKNK